MLRQQVINGQNLPIVPEGDYFKNPRWQMATFLTAETKSRMVMYTDTVNPTLPTVRKFAW